MKLSKNFRIGLLFAGLILLLLNLFMVEYDLLLSGENLGAGFRIASNLFLIVAMFVSLRYTKDL